MFKFFLFFNLINLFFAWPFVQKCLCAFLTHPWSEKKKPVQNCHSYKNDPLCKSDSVQIFLIVQKWSFVQFYLEAILCLLAKMALCKSVLCNFVHSCNFVISCKFDSYPKNSTFAKMFPCKIVCSCKGNPPAKVSLYKSIFVKSSPVMQILYLPVLCITALQT